MGRANSKKVKDFLRKKEREDRYNLNEKENQSREAIYIQGSFGVWRDPEKVETVNLMTPEEIEYYLNITFGHVQICAVPDTAIRGCILEQGFTYQVNMNTITVTNITESE